MHLIKLFARQFLLKALFLVISCGGMSLFAQPYAIVIHGGSGNIDPQSISDERKEAYLAKMAEALKVGEDMLKSGAASLDVVETVVKILEDSPLFNAGKGAVFNIEGKNELDASIMCGATHNAGSVAGLSTIKNPVSAARKVMEESPHVMLTGKSADAFAYEHGIEMVDPGYFFDQVRWDQYREYVRNSFNRERGQAYPADGNLKMGTVGAVALDMKGNLAAATSTGGMTGKYPGRVGDSPLIGAGNYASNLSCGVSATGHGEFFIRNMVAYDIAARVMYKGQALNDAAREVINGKLKEQQANGGIIAIDKDGNVVMEFNTTAMFRGYTSSNGEKGVWIFRDE
jgi:beta-aspartyl-peptidase (threonine type)